MSQPEQQGQEIQMKMEMSPQLTQETTMLAEMYPVQIVQQTYGGVDLLDHIGAEDFWVKTRDEALHHYPEHRTWYIVVWGRTGVGKRQIASQMLFLVQHDPHYKEQLRERGIDATEEYIAFAEAANLARARGTIDALQGHGRYTDEDYRQASIVHSEYALRRLNNLEGLFMEVLEPSGPTGFFNIDKTFEGTDRALSTVKLLGERAKATTRILVVKRGVGLRDKIYTSRDAIIKASNKDVAKVLVDTNLQFYDKEGKLVDLVHAPLPFLTKLRQGLVDSMAPKEGVIRSNDQMERMMRDRYHITNPDEQEEEFWHQFLSDLGFTTSDYDIVDNPVTSRRLTIHQDLLESCDPMQDELAVRKRAAKSPFRLVGEEVVGVYKKGWGPHADFWQ